MDDTIARFPAAVFSQIEEKGTSHATQSSSIQAPWLQTETGEKQQSKPKQEM